MPRGIYKRSKPTGFLHPWNEHVVTVERLGMVYRGRNKREARRAFIRWANLSRSDHGRASGRHVMHTVNGEAVDIHYGRETK